MRDTLTLRPAQPLLDLVDVRLEALTVRVLLLGHPLGCDEDRLDAAQVERDVAGPALLDDAGDDVADAAGELAVLRLVLGVADALHDQLARDRRGEATEVVGRVLELFGERAARAARQRSVALGGLGGRARRRGAPWPTR